MIRGGVLTHPRARGRGHAQEKERQLAKARMERNDVLEIVMANERLHMTAVAELQQTSAQLGAEALELQRLQHDMKEVRGDCDQAPVPAADASHAPPRQLEEVFDVITTLRADRMENLRRRKLA